MKPRTLVGSLVVLSVISCANWALAEATPTEKKTVADKAVDYAKLPEAANKTLEAWSKAVQEGKEKRPGVIPKQYWADPIPALKPLAVREHTLSILIVMKQTKTEEQGLFFLSPLSSRIPRIMFQKAGEADNELGATEEFFDLTLRRTEKGIEYTYKLPQKP